MPRHDMLFWPDEFEDGFVDFDDWPVEKVLSLQLVAWGNTMMGSQPPDMFYEVMEAASKVTGAFTSVECRDRAAELIRQKKTEKVRGER